MPEYNFNFSGLDNLNYDAGVDLKFMNSDAGKRMMYGTPPPADVMRYPLKAIEKEQDMLLIRIFDRVENPFGLKNVIQGEYTPDLDKNGKETGTSTLTKFERFGKLKSTNRAFNEAGSTYDGEKALKQNARYIWLPIPQQISDSTEIESDICCGMGNQIYLCLLYTSPSPRD